MIHLQTITNVSDCIPLYLPHSLYLKPVAKLSISVGLPPNKMGKSISNFDIMDKLTKALAPDKFLVLKVSKSTIDVIRLEAELEEPTRLPNALSRLDGMTFKVNGFTEPFKVRAKESKDDFPNRHDWDIFFRDAHFMDEMKAGERPDTIHLANLPIRWFCPRHMENEDTVKPSESIFKRIFEKFGAVRAVDIPLCDAFRQKMSSDVNGMRVHNFEQDLYFEGYVQFEEYIGFVRAMDEFRGMKLVRKFVDKTQAVNIIVDFDKRKHLSDASVTRRERLRKSLLAKVKAKEEEEERKKKKEQEMIERERKLAEELKLKELERQREREEQRKKKHLKKLEEKGQIEISRKIRLEEKKLLIVRRKLESIRVLEALFERLKLKDIQEKGKPVTFTTIDLRQRLIDKYKSATEKLLEEQKKKLEEEKLQTGLSGLLKSHDHTDDHLANGQAKANGKKKKKGKSSTESSSSASERESERKKADAGLQVESVYNPFKDVYTPEAAAELMKMSMMSYGMFQGMPVYRPPFPPHHGIRGYMPRGRGGHLRGMRRGGYSYNESPTYSSEAAEAYVYGLYPRLPAYRQSYPRSYNVRSYSRSRSRKRSRSRSRSRTRSRSYTRSRSRTRSRHRHYSRSRRSRNRSYSRSRSRSRTRSRSRSKRSYTRDHSRPRSESRDRGNRSRSGSESQFKPKSHLNRSKSERSHSRSRPRHCTRSKTRSQSKSRTRTKRSTSNPKSASRSNRDRSKGKSPQKPKKEAHVAPKSNCEQSRSRSKSKTRKQRESSTPTKSTRERSKSRSQSKSKSNSENHRARSTSIDAANSKVRSKSNSRTHRLNSNSNSKSKSHKVRSRSRSPNKSESRKPSKKLVSTRRSLSQVSWSRSPSPPRRSWSKNRDP